MTFRDPINSSAGAAFQTAGPPERWSGKLAAPAAALAQGALAALDSLIPPACLLCGDGEVSAKFCRLCEVALLNTWPPKSTSCQFCGMPRPAEPVSVLDVHCPLCKAAVNIRGLDRVVAFAVYQGAVREAIVASKLARHTSLATALGQLLGEHVKAKLNAHPPDCVTYVPTPLIRRIQRRGLSGGAAMAEETAKALNVQCVSLLRLTRHISKQSLLPDADRPKNVSGAFALKKGYAWPRRLSLRDQHILLVDDVLTTGSTASEIARVVKDAGAARVTLAVVARAVRQ
jgi:predicted amidophosphoribosyltransferase